MSISTDIGESVVDWGRHKLRWPGRIYHRVRDTLHRVRTGEIRPIDIVMTVVGTSGAWLLLLALMFPIYWIFTAAVSGPGSTLYSTEGFRVIPATVTVETFVWVLGDLIVPKYWISLPGNWVLETPRIVLMDASNYGVESPSEFKKYFWNSLTVSLPTVALAMAMVVPSAYALSRRKFIGRSKVLYGYILFTQIGGGLGVATLIALYAMLVDFGLTNDKFVLALYYAATAVPFNTWLLKTYIDGIPVSYEEAAVVDGAPPWRVVVEVILPLSKAGLATVFIFTFLVGWTEFIVAQTVLLKENFTLPVGLFALVGEYNTPWAYFAAFALTFATPIMLVYLYMQKYIEAGLSFGGN